MDAIDQHVGRERSGCTAGVHDSQAVAGGRLLPRAQERVQGGAFGSAYLVASAASNNDVLCDISACAMKTKGRSNMI